MGAHGIIVGILLFMVFGGSLKAEVAKGLAYLWPALPWLIGLYLISGTTGNAVNAATGWIARLINKVSAFVYGVGFIAFVVPVMIADTYLLGPLAMFAWKHMEIQVLLVIASGFGFWYVTETPIAIPKKYMVAAVVSGVAIIVLGYVAQFMFNTHFVNFKPQSGIFYADPFESIEVKGGDHIRFIGHGYTVTPTITKGKKVNSVLAPDGNLTKLVSVPAGAPRRPEGQLQFTLTEENGTLWDFRVKSLEVGPTKILGFLDFRDLVDAGYYISGEAYIPKDFPTGKLGVEFFNISPTKGGLRLTLIVNAGETGLAKAANRFLFLEGDPTPTKNEWRIFYHIIGLIAIAALLIGGPVSAYRSPQGVFFHLPTIALWLLVSTGAFFLGDLLFFGGMGPTSTWRSFTGWWKT